MYKSIPVEFLNDKMESIRSNTCKQAALYYCSTTISKNFLVTSEKNQKFKVVFKV